MSNLSTIPPIVFHATTSNYIESIHENINVDISNNRGDFGKGFYTTSNAKQALKWARKKEAQHNVRELSFQKMAKTYKNEVYTPNFVKGVVIKISIDIHKLAQNTNTHQIFEYPPSEDWADFVYCNRSELDHVHGYHNRDNTLDVVYGPVADGLVQAYVSEIDNEGIDQESLISFLEKISSEDFMDYDQLSFHNQEHVNHLLEEKIIKWEGVSILNDGYPAKYRERAKLSI